MRQQRVPAIEHGVPLPSLHRARKPQGYGSRPLLYPFARMLVGDSFFVPGKKATVLSAAWAPYRRRLGWTFTARSVTEGVRGCRVWRTS